MKKAFSILLAIILLSNSIMGLRFYSSASDLPADGKFGDNVSFTFDSESGVLSFSGNGEMYDYNKRFYNNLEIKKIVINYGITSIGAFAFSGCTNLTNVSICNSVTNINSHAFENCSNLCSISIPDSVKKIESYAFENCGFTSILIPQSVSYVDASSFRGCTFLNNICVDNRNSIYDSRDSCNAIINTESNTLICGCKNTIIPNTIKRIRDGAFEDCTGLQSIVIPHGVVSIGNYAFDHCSGLKSVMISDSLESVSGYAFSNCASLEKIVVDKKNNVLDSRDNCNAIIKDTTLLVGCKSTIIPNGITRIGESAFEGCSELESINLPNSIHYIDSFAFHNCIQLNNVIIPDSVLSISYDVFSGCTNLQYFVIGKNVTCIKWDILDDCPQLFDIWYVGTEEEWKKIEISVNEGLFSKRIHYNCAGSGNSTSVPSEMQQFTAYNKDEFLSGKSVKNAVHLRLNEVLLKTNSDNISFNQETLVSNSKIQGKQVVFCKEEFNNYVIPTYVTNDSKWRNVAAHNVYMQKSETGSKPYVSTVFVQQLTKKNQAHSAYKEVQNEKLTILESIKYNVIISAETRGANNVTYYLSQDNSHRISNNTGVFLEKELYSHFSFNAPIYAYVVCDGKTSTPVKVQLEKQQVKGALKNIMTNSTINIFGANSTKFTLPDSVPIMGGSSVSTDFIQCPVGVEVEGNRVRLSLGFDLFKESNTFVNGKLDEQKWTDYKNACKGLQNATKDANKSMKEFRKFLKQKGYKRGSEASKTFGMDFFGYIEGNIVNGGLVITDVSGTLAAEFAYKLKAQFGPLGIPAFYAYVKAGAEASATVNTARAMPDTNVPLVFDVTIGLTPKVAGGAGIGLEGVVSGGAYAEATMPVKYAIAKKNLKLDLTGEIGIEGYFIVVSGKVPIFQGETNLINHTFGSRGGAAVASFNEVQQAIQASKETVEVLNRDYVESQKWVAQAETKSNRKGMSAASLADDSFTTQTLEQSVNQNPQVKLVTFGNKAMMVWVDDDASRDTYNRYKLVYSIYNGSTWSTPQAIDDCGTNDYAPSVITIGNNVYIAYQNFKNKLNSVDDSTVKNLLKASEIKVTKYNATTGKFENTKTITSNSTYDYQPVVTNENGNAVVYWANCTSTDYASGSVSVKKSNFSGSTSTIVSEKNYIYELNAIGSDVYYTMQDSVVDTSDYDLNLYKNNVKITENDGSDSQALPMSLSVGEWNGNSTLFYTDSMNIYRLEGQTPTALFEGGVNVSGGLEVIDYEGTPTAVWCETTDYGSEFYTSSYESGTWTQPVQLQEYGGLVSSLSLADCSGNLLGAFTKTVRNKDADGNYTNGQSDLCLFKTQGQMDISIALSEFDESTLNIGEESAIQVYVENTGTENITTIDFTVSDSFGNFQIITKEVNLLSGSDDIVALPYIPTKLEGGTITITADVSDDKNVENNQFEIEIGNADLALSDITLEQFGNNNVITALLKNQGNASVTESQVNVLSNDIEINAISVGELKPGEQQKISFYIPSDNLVYDEENYCSMISLQVTTQTKEVTESNNNSAITFENISSSTFSHQMHCFIPQFNDIKTTITIKSDENEYSVTSENGIFEISDIPDNNYKVYAKQKNSLSIFLGDFISENGEITNYNSFVIPVGDVNEDDVIDIADISLLLATENYGQANADIDLTGDGLITIDDISTTLLVTNYGKSSVKVV